MDTDDKKSSDNIIKDNNTNISYNNNNIPFLNEVFEPIKPLSTEESDLVCSIAMNKDYTDIITSVILSINNYSENIPSEEDYPFFKENHTIKFIPKLTNAKSEILSERKLRELHQNIPYYQRYKNLKLLFSTSVHGISMSTFFENTKDYKVSIVIIKDDDQNVFGGYLSEEIRRTDKFYGTGESFVFSFHKGERIHIYEGTTDNEYYIYSDNDLFAMGCSDGQFSLAVRNQFLKGSSRQTSTYKNSCLASNEEFFITKFEVWTFEE